MNMHTIGCQTPRFAGKSRWTWSLAALAFAAMVSLAFSAEPLSGPRQTAGARQDADVVRRLSAEGQLLYERDRVQLDAYQYCGQAVGLAERGDFRASIQAASKALHLGIVQDDADILAVAKRDLAIAYSYAGDTATASRFAREAIEHARHEPQLVRGPAFKIIGDAQAREGRHAEAVVSYRSAVAESSERFRPLARISLANALLAAGDVASARREYDALGAVSSRALGPVFHRGVGNLLIAEGKAEAAIASFETAVKASAGTDATWQRIWALEGVSRAHLLRDDRPAARDALREATDLSDSLRSRFRSDEFKAGLFSDVQSIFERAIQLALDDGDTAAAWRLSEQSRSRALLDQVRGRVATGLQREGAIASGVAPLAEVQAALAADEAIVQYHGVGARMIAWVIRAGGIRHHVLPLAATDVARQIGAMRAAAADYKGDPSVPARALHAALVAPLDLRGVERLLIVPHDRGHYLPFQALLGPSGYLIEQYAIAFAPSASVAVQIAVRNRASGGSFVGFGNPVLDALHADLPDLPDAEAEVKKVSALFPGSSVYLREAATKPRFLEAAVTARVLHVAAHAKVDELDPLRSRILLSRGGDGPGDLEAREIYDLDLRGVSLVTLSACETGLGQVTRGDEILGFTRSFLSAGAAGLVVSLWEVADDSTALLMTQFYGELARGLPAIDAMRRAQLALLRDRRYARPFFWAAFNLVGDWRMRTATKG